MSRPVGVTVWAQIKPKFGKRYSNGVYEDCVEGASITTTTVNRPLKPPAGVLLLKLRVIVPESAFLPFVPEAVIQIPEDMLNEQILAVEALDPREVE